MQGVEACDDRFGLRKEKGEWLFQLSTAERTYYLVGPDEATMSYWIDGVRKVCEWPRSSRSSLRERPGDRGIVHVDSVFSL